MENSFAHSTAEVFRWNRSRTFPHLRSIQYLPYRWYLQSSWLQLLFHQCNHSARRHPLRTLHPQKLLRLTYGTIHFVGRAYLVQNPVPAMLQIRFQIWSTSRATRSQITEKSILSVPPMILQISETFFKNTSTQTSVQFHLTLNQPSRVQIVNAARIPPRPGYRPATDDQRQRGTGHKATEAEGSRDNPMVLGKSKRDRNCIRQ